MKDELILDSGASDTICVHRDKFIIYEEMDEPASAITAASRAKGRVFVEFKVHDDNGEFRTVTTKVIHVPEGHKNLFSPQHYFQDCEEEYRQNHL